MREEEEEEEVERKWRDGWREMTQQLREKEGYNSRRGGEYYNTTHWLEEEVR